jgi:hypothetical protein
MRVFVRWPTDILFGYIALTIVGWAFYRHAGGEVTTAGTIAAVAVAVAVVCVNEILARRHVP